MHAWLAFVSGVCAAVGALLFFAAVIGLNFYGLDARGEAVLAVVVVIVAVIAAVLLYKGLISKYVKVKTGLEALVGSKGVAVTDLKPKGEIRVMGEFWQAISKGAVIASGQTVEVTGIEGMFLTVKPVEDKA
jgi:membrane-bound serine protease (ClpP class)